MLANLRSISSIFLAGLAALLLALTPACSDSARPETRPTPSRPAPVQPTPPPPAPVAAPATGDRQALTPTPTTTPPRPPADPDAQSTPAATPTAGVAATPMGPVTDPFPAPPDRDLFQLARELSLPPDYSDIPRVVNPQPVSYAAGRVDEFWLVDLDGLEIYRSTFELRLVSPTAYWYVEKGQEVRQAALERAAAEFEEVIYPRVTGYFGQEWTPGVDNDPHLNIIHGHIRGAAGYFSSTDEYPTAVRPRSNQREMIYINSDYLTVGSDVYLQVLAHELQHAIHWNHDPSDEAWISEGLAELAVTVAGYVEGAPRSFMRRPFVSLVHWPIDNANIGAHYGGASLFMHYLAEHYGGHHGSNEAQAAGNLGNLRQLQDETADDIRGVDAFLSETGAEVDFHAVFQDWVAANFLDEERGIYGYGDWRVSVRESRVVSKFTQLERKGEQYGTHYVEIASGLHSQPLTVKFAGVSENRLLPVEVGEAGCWWSNTGDSIAASLTRTLDLPRSGPATLTYQVWYAIEKEWDYGYVQVSTDGGRHWQILETPYTSAANPVGGAFGPGYTGKSRGWQEESIDLSDYAGQKIQVRFQYVTDDAVNDIGLCLRGLSLPAAGVSADDMDWQADGFIHIDNRVPQYYFVQVMQQGAENRINRMSLALNGSGALTGQVTVEPYDGLKRTMIAVSPAAPRTREKAPYILTLEPAG